MKPPMTSDQPSLDTSITIDDFRASGYDNVLRDEAGTDSWALSERLSIAAKAADEEGRTKVGGVLHLLARVTSMMLTPEDKTTPFQPWAQFGGRRSSIPTDFTDDDVTLFASVVATVEHPQLRARLADLVWVRDRKRGIAMVPLAIDAYCDSPLVADTWFSGGRDGWSRALSLALTIRDSARVTSIEAALVGATLADHGHGYVPLEISRILLDNRLGAAVRGDIAARLEALAEANAESGRYRQAVKYFGAAGKWYARENTREKAISMTVRAASCWEIEGDALVGMGALHSYENAIKQLRTVPAPDRAAHAADATITKLMGKVSEAGQAALGQMQMVRSDSQDITELVNMAIAAISDQDPLDALAAFAEIYCGASVQTIRKNAQANLDMSLFGRLFSSSVISAQGNTIARQPAADGDASGAALWADMVRDYKILIGLVVHSGIAPALTAMQMQHVFTIWDMEALCDASPFVPPDRATLVAQGLYAGYCGDLVQAVHILVPQVEHIVRTHLQHGGAITTTTSKEGIVMENGMSTLVKLPQMAEVFGDDLTFELTALFCDQNGPNLRNEVAHGLISRHACESDAGVYAWWFVFSLMFKTFWQAQQELAPTVSGAPVASSDKPENRGSEGNGSISR